MTFPKKKAARLEGAYKELQRLAWFCDESTHSEYDYGSEDDVGDPDLCARYIYGCQDILEEILDFFVEAYPDISRDDVFRYLFNRHVLKMDYSQLKDILDDIQIEKDYHGYTISGMPDIGDINEYMESMLKEVFSLE
ncbi:MAG: hypothetical protein ACP5SH_01085 [Syntrophobacteraceae bacterium]